MLKPIARPDLLARVDNDTGFLKFRLAEQVEGWRLPLPHVNEDKAAIFVHRISRNPNVTLRARTLCRALGALPCSIIFPTMIHTPEFIALHPTGVKLGEAVRTTVQHNIGTSALPAIKREILAEHADFPSLSWLNAAR
ncbi:hypothetical protein GCM10027081_42000 [Cupriavidus yeoncheonensis]